MGNLSSVRLAGLIRLVRGRRVILDRDLARLYGVRAIALRQQVRRNKRRFPPDFMFALTKRETKSLVSQSVIPSRRSFGGALPLVFTQEGVAMLSSVLRSPRAVAANISIMRAFVRYRETLMTNAGLAEKFWQLEGKVDRHDKEIGGIMSAIRELIAPPPRPKREIGFKPS